MSSLIGGVTLSAELTLKQAIEIAREADMLLEPDKLQKPELEAVEPRGVDRRQPDF
jgi:hypothetical protein